MTYSPFGYSLPLLSVTGYAAREAAYGGQLTVDVTVENQGASSLIEPLDLPPGSTNNTLVSPPTNSTADSGPTTVEVYASPKPNSNFHLVKLDTITIPSIPQNSSVDELATFNLPAKPRGYPGNGGKIYITLVVDNNQGVLQSSQALNIYRVPNPVKITNNLPDLQVVAFDIPNALQPGDVISPTIRIANFGAGNPNLQGPVTVELVASLDKNFGPGDSVLGSYVINSLPGVSNVPTQGQSVLFGDTNLFPPANELTTTLPPVKLPSTPGTYYIGIEIDPTGSIQQTYAPSPALRDPIKVGPKNPLLPPAGLLVNTSQVVPVFPALPSTIIGPTFPPNGTTLPPLIPLPPILAAPFVAASPTAPRKSSRGR